MKKQILKELLRTEEKYHFSSADLLRAAPIWLVETQDSMDSLYHEMESLVRELVRKNIFRKGASTALELYSAFRQTESGVELGFQNTAGAYLPGYDQWMEYISGKLGVSNALIALHIRDTDPAVLNTDGLQRIWRCMSAYKAHCLTLVIVDSALCSHDKGEADPVFSVRYGSVQDRCGQGCGREPPGRPSERAFLLAEGVFGPDPESSVVSGCKRKQ